MGHFEVAQMDRRKYGNPLRDMLWARVGKLEAGLLFTLKFDDAGNWKIVKTQQISEKELEEEQ